MFKYDSVRLRKYLDLCSGQKFNCGTSMIVHYILKILKSLEYKNLRKRLLSSFSSYGLNFRFHPKSIFTAPQEMSFGDDVFINIGAHFSGEICVGNDVMFGPRVTAFAHDHYYAVCGKKLVDIESIRHTQRIKIGNHCWIGANATILAGTVLGQGCVVAAGTTIKGQYPPYTMVAGSPARVLRKIFADENLYLHLTTLGYSPEQSELLIFERSESTEGLELYHVEQSLPYGSMEQDKSI